MTESFALLEFSSYSPPSLLDATHLCSGVGEAFPLSRMLSVYSTDGFQCFLILHSPIFQFLGPFHVLLSVQKVNAIIWDCGKSEEKLGPATTIVFEM